MTEAVMLLFLFTASSVKGAQWMFGFFPVTVKSADHRVFCSVCVMMVDEDATGQLE